MPEVLRGVPEGKAGVVKVRRGERWLHLLLTAWAWAALAYYDSTSAYVSMWVFLPLVGLTLIHVRCFVILTEIQKRQSP